MSIADWTCATCTTEGRRGSCCPGRCYCAHETCHAAASWVPREGQARVIHLPEPRAT